MENHDDNEYNTTLKLLISKKYINEAIDLINTSGNRKLNLDFLTAFSIVANNCQMVEALIKRGVDVSSEKNKLLLTLASMMGYYDIAKILIAAGAPVNDYALAVAASNGHDSIIGLLIKNAGNLSANNNLAIKWAYLNNHMSTVGLLIKNGAEASNLDELMNKNNLYVVTCELITVTFRINKISYDKQNLEKKTWIEYSEKIY